MSPQLSCDNTCQIWTWYTIANIYFGDAEKLGKSRNGGNCLSNPHPWFPGRFSQASATYLKIGCPLCELVALTWLKALGKGKLISAIVSMGIQSPSNKQKNRTFYHLGTLVPEASTISRGWLSDYIPWSMECNYLAMPYRYMLLAFFFSRCNYLAYIPAPGTEVHISYS